MNWLPAASASLLMLAVTWSTAFWAFSGERIVRTAWSRIGPGILLTAFALATAGVVGMWQAVSRRCAAADSLRSPLVASATLAGAAFALLYVDQSWLVLLYARLHAVLETCAWLLLWSVASFWLGRPSALRASQRRAMAAVTVAGLALGLGLASRSRAFHLWSDGLAHCLSEELYVGRTLRRVEDLGAWRLDPTGALGITSTGLRLEKLTKQYDITSSTLGREWQTREHPSNKPTPGERATERERPDIVIYYVDTLRYDVASDPDVMPSVARFLDTSLSFSRAYAAGSDTATSLPVITTGRFGDAPDTAGDLLSLANHAGYETSVIVPRSAREYLAVRRPEFRFASTSEVADYATGKQVWGYGADLPTGPEIVRQAIEKLAAPRQQPLLLWLFHYDQHNWQQLPQSHSDKRTEEHSRSSNKGLDLRYLTVAASLDREFGRLETALSSLGLRENTVIVFLSDHGEAMGRNGFFAHSIHLWEELIHVPLGLSLPGLAPQRVDDAVSLADVTPTLAPYFGHAGSYHGEDLRFRLDKRRGSRKLPILFSATVGGTLLRAGLLDPAGTHKLVLPIDAARPELYDLNSPDPDRRNLAGSSPERVAALLETLLRSPIFPR